MEFFTGSEDDAREFMRRVRGSETNGEDPNITHEHQHQFTIHQTENGWLATCLDPSSHRQQIYVFPTFGGLLDWMIKRVGVVLASGVWIEPQDASRPGDVWMVAKTDDFPT